MNFAKRTNIKAAPIYGITDDNLGLADLLRLLCHCLSGNARLRTKLEGGGLEIGQIR